MPAKIGYLLLVFFSCLNVLSGRAQVDTSAAAFRVTLIQNYRQLQQFDTLRSVIPCTFDSTALPQHLLLSARAFNLLGQPACATTIFQWLEKKNNLTSKERAILLLAEAEYFHVHQLYDTAKSLALQAGQLATVQKQYDVIINALLILSGGALKRRQILNAYQWADSALLLSRQTRDHLLEGKALLQMALVERRHFTASAHRAFPYYLEAMTAAEAGNDSITLFSSYLYYAMDNLEVDNRTEGIFYYQKAMNLVINSRNAYQHYTACVATGLTLSQMGCIQESLMLFRMALGISQRQQLPYNIQHSFFEIAGSFERAKQYDSALVYADLAASVPGVDSFWANMWKVKAGIYDKMGNYKLAASMYQKAMEWANEDFLYRNQDQLSGYEAKLKTTEKELQAIGEKRKRIQLEWIIGASVLLFLLAVAGYILQRTARRKLALQNAIIEKQRVELAVSLGEKEILLKEIHHRVKNNLSVICSLLELQSGGIADSKAKAAIIEAQGRVRSIALIHQRLYQRENLSTVDLHDLAKELVRQLHGLFNIGSNKIVTDIDIPPTMLDIDTAIPLGLIINELLTNSYKYAFTGTTSGCITMQLTKMQPGHFVLRYTDSGPGLPEGFEPGKNTSMGLRLIYRLSQQLGGHTSYSREDPKGFTICFKDSINRNQEHG